MISADDALDRILAALVPLPSEVIGFADGDNRVLAQDVTARLTQPPSDVSAMDGYAVRAVDVETVPVELEVIGTSKAGGTFDGVVGPGRAARIFTGATVPQGADTIIIQEDTERGGENQIRVLERADPGRHIRLKGVDFQDGESLLKKGQRLTSRDLALLAAMDINRIEVTQRPRLALLATGDELVRPGEPVAAHQIISSTPYALAAWIKRWGGQADILDIARDNEDSLRQAAKSARDVDILVTLGGASVGDHDLVQSVLGKEGLHVDFWKVAIKPGKPLIFGDIAGTTFLGLPGNPVSALVCGLLFLRPAIGALLGINKADLAPPLAIAHLGKDLSANSKRQDYIRARLSRDAAGRLVVIPFDLQDSSVLSVFAAADCLIVRKPLAQAAKKGDLVDIWPLG